MHFKKICKWIILDCISVGFSITFDIDKLYGIGRKLKAMILSIFLYRRVINNEQNWTETFMGWGRILRYKKLAKSVDISAKWSKCRGIVEKISLISFWGQIYTENQINFYDKFLRCWLSENFEIQLLFIVFLESNRFLK